MAKSLRVYSHSLAPWKKQAPLEELVSWEKYQKLSSRAHILEHVTKPTNKTLSVLEEMIWSQVLPDRKAAFGTCFKAVPTVF